MVEIYTNQFVFISLVFKFVEPPENNEKPEKSRLKFKIMSLKVKGPIDYVPEMVSEICIITVAAK